MTITDDVECPTCGVGPGVMCRGVWRPTLQQHRKRTTLHDTRRAVAHPSPADILSRMTENGGWTKATLAAWGVPWPPPKGWRSELERAWKQEKAPQAP